MQLYHILKILQQRQKIRPSFLGRIVLLYKVSNYLLSLIAACDTIRKRGKLVL